LCLGLKQPPCRPVHPRYFARLGRQRPADAVVFADT
jgi:hypothetical protein